MLTIVIPEREYFDEENECFIHIKKTTLQLEHSLVSLSKWESKWKEPFLTKDVKSIEKSLDYIRCMTITQNVDPLVYYGITPEILDKINAYMEEEMTATTFNEMGPKKQSRDVITAEIIYYWMLMNNIPLECQKWHLSRLMTLIRVFSIKNAPDKKMSKREVMSQQRALNEARKKKLGTKG